MSGTVDATRGTRGSSDADPGTGVHVTVARAGDLPAVAALLERAGLPLAGLGDVWCTWVARLVATSGDQGDGSQDGNQDGGREDGEDGSREDGAGVVGAVALERHDDPTAPGGASYLLRSLVVDASLRGRGVGQALVRTALSAANAGGSGTPAVGLLTQTAADFFPRLGFVEVERSGLPAALGASPQLAGVCGASARAFVLSRPT